MTKRTRLALFDIDGTIFRSSLIIELFNELVRRGVFPERAKREVERDYVNWLNRRGHYNDYIMRVVKVFYREITECSARRIAPAVRATVAWQKDRVHRFPKFLMQDLRRRGFFILAVSNSPMPMVKQFAHAVGFDDAIGHALKDGTAWMDKVAVLRHFISEHELSVDLRASVMIGDSEGDLPLLSLVGHPIAFNPSAALARIARRRGWRIVVERKDVVYDVRDARLMSVPGTKPRVPYGTTKR